MSDFSVSRTRKIVDISCFDGVDASTDESTLPLTKSPLAYNVSCYGGVLREGYSALPYTIGSADTAQVTTLAAYQPVKTWYWYMVNALGVRDDRIVIWCGNSTARGSIKVLRCNTGAVYDTTFTADPDTDEVLGFCYDNGYEDDFVMFTSSGSLFVLEYNSQDSKSDRLHFTDHAVANKCSFLIRGGTAKPYIFYSKHIDPRTWYLNHADAGQFVLDTSWGYGRPERLVAIDNAVYVMREYGITRLTVYSDRSFKSNNLITFPGRLYPETVTRIDSEIFFVTTEGVFSFDGYDLKRRLTELFPLIDKSISPRAYAYHGKYYLSAKMVSDGKTIGDEATYTLTRNALFVYDTIDGETSIMRGAEVESFLPIADAAGVRHPVLVMGKGSNEYRLEELKRASHPSRAGNIALKGVWNIPSTDFGCVEKTKVLRKLYIKTAGALDVGISVDGKAEDVYHLTGLGSVKIITLNKPFERLSVSLGVTDADTFLVRDVKMEIELTEKYNAKQRAV